MAYVIIHIVKGKCDIQIPKAASTLHVFFACWLSKIEEDCWRAYSGIRYCLGVISHIGHDNLVYLEGLLEDNSDRQTKLSTD